MSDPEIENVALELGVVVDVPELLGVVVEVPEALGVVVDVPEALGVVVDVADELAVELAVDDASTTVCVSVPIGMTSQLVPSEMAKNAPPINSLAVA